MDDRSWMYQDSPKGYCMMNYCNEVQGFINYELSNSINISGDDIRCPYKRCKNKKFFNLDVVTMHLLQKSLWINICFGFHKEIHMFFMKPW
jgi:hypothetical protein